MRALWCRLFHKKHWTEEQPIRSWNGSSTHIFKSYWCKKCERRYWQ